MERKKRCIGFPTAHFECSSSRLISSGSLMRSANSCTCTRQKSIMGMYTQTVASLRRTKNDSAKAHHLHVRGELRDLGSAAMLKLIRVHFLYLEPHTAFFRASAINYKSSASKQSHPWNSLALRVYCTVYQREQLKSREETSPKN